MICEPLSGWLSDRYGRRRVMIVLAAVPAVIVLPAFCLIVRHLGLGPRHSISTLLACVLGLSTGTVLVAAGEALPRARRPGGFALVHAVAISAFGGSTHFAVAWLIRVTGNPLSPAFTCSRRWPSASGRCAASRTQRPHACRLIRSRGWRHARPARRGRR